MAFFLHVLIVACMHLFGGLGYNLVFGKAKLLHFGLGAVSLLCAYTLWVLIVQYAVSFPVAFCAAFAVTLLFALLTSWLSVRLKADAFGVLTLAIHLIVLTIVLNWQSVTRGALGIPKIPRGILPENIAGYALIVCLCAILWTVTVFWIDRGKLGRALAALAEHPWHGEALGINRFRTTFFALMILGIGTLIGDSFFAPFLRLLSPSDFGFPLLIFFMMIVIAGKPGSVLGFTIATFLLTFLKEGIRFIRIPLLTETGWQIQYLPNSLKGPLNLILFGAILFAAVWWRRDVLFPKGRDI